MRFLLWVCALWRRFVALLRVFFSPGQRRRWFGRHKPYNTRLHSYRRPPKPPWVRHEILRLKALMPEMGCRTIAHTFNRRFASTKGMTVGKTFVHQMIRTHQYDILVLRRKIKNAQPRLIPTNVIWGMDLTGKTDTHGREHPLMGIVEHGSRLNLCLAAVRDKSSVTLLGHLLETIQRYGKPKILRTDSEPVFTSALFRLTLWLLGMRHHRIDPHCPWQNGRIERFFGTLKQKLDQWEVDGLKHLEGALSQFQVWYNHIRPHQNLGGRTPAEVWHGRDVFTCRPQREYWFEAWDGLLTGLYLRL